MIEDNINKLNKVYDLLMKTEGMDTEHKVTFLQENWDEFIDFYYEHSVYVGLFQMEDGSDKNQAAMSRKYFEIIKWVMLNVDVFKQIEYFDYIPDQMLATYNEHEEYNAMAFVSHNKKTIEDFYNLKRYLDRREELENIISSIDESKRTETQNSYLKGHKQYMKMYYGHVLPFIEHNYTEMPEEEILSFISEIEESGIIDEVVQSNKKLQFYDSNLIFQYCMFAIKAKNKFRPDEILDDKVIQYLWNGKITNEQVIDFLLGNSEKQYQEKKQNVSVGNIIDVQDVFTRLLKREGYEGHFYSCLNEHFKKVGLPTKIIYEIMKNIIPNCSKSVNLELLTDLGVPENVEDYIGFHRDNPYDFVLYNTYIIDLLKEQERGVLEGRNIFVPYDYIVKKIPNLTQEVTENIITLLKSGYYNEKSEKLEELLIEYGFNNVISLSREDIVFNDNDSIDAILKKAQNAYASRQVIPLEIAKKIIKENYDNGIELNEYIFKACVCSIIHYSLKEEGIDIGSRVFFGENNSTFGFYNTGNPNAIWINNSLIRRFVRIGEKEPPESETDLEKKSRVFITMFHEMRHARQYNNIDKGSIDFLTYNFIKEQVLEMFDANFYDANYKKMFIEEDAREYGVIDAMKFLKGLELKKFDGIFARYKKVLESEVASGNINRDGSKKLSFRGNKKIRNTEYISRLIKDNPKILEKYSILEIEYNKDGSLKDIHTMIAEYDERKKEIEKRRRF